MSRPGFGDRAGWILWGAALLLVCAAGALLWRSSQPREGPAPVAWDRQRCAHCGMLVSERGFAAQAQLTSGEVLHFDDPGELLLQLAEETRPVRAVWLHHAEAERWIPRERAAFVRVASSPMGFGLAAVEAGERTDALDWERALEHARAVDAARPTTGPRQETAEPGAGEAGR